MPSKKEIRQRGMKALIEELGDLDTEVFIKMLIREPFDYTNWQRNLWNDSNVKEIDKKAQQFQEKLEQNKDQ